MPAHKAGVSIHSSYLPATIYQGVIENGCAGTPATTFKLTLKSSIYHNTNVQEAFGEITLNEEVNGHGYL
jgi:hypothetical protein